MHWTATLRNQTLPERSRVAGDLPCIECGYNLRRAKPDGVCPECGSQIRNTLDAATHPRDLGESLRRIAPTCLTALAGVLLLSYALGSWLAIIGGMFIAAGGAFRLLAILALVRTGSLRPFPAAESSARLLIWISAASAAAAVVLTILAFVGIKALSSAIDNAFGLGLIAWSTIVACELVMMALIGRNLAKSFEYAILKWESNGLLILLAGGAALAGLIAFIVGLSSGGDIPAMISTFMLIFFLLVGVPAVVLAAVLMFHLGNAAERARQELEDILEEDAAAA